MTNDLLALASCPFCGETSIYLNAPSDYYPRGSINCPSCMVVMPGAIGGADREEELIERWNERAADLALLPADAIERAARRIAKVQGDDFDQCPKDKSDWVEKRGQFDGRYRDVNEPFQSCYLAMAESALGDGVVVPDGWKLVPVEPADEMYMAVTADLRGADHMPESFDLTDAAWAKRFWKAMLSAAPSAPPASKPDHPYAPEAGKT